MNGFFNQAEAARRVQPSQNLPMGTTVMMLFGRKSRFSRTHSARLCGRSQSAGMVTGLSGRQIPAASGGRFEELLIRKVWEHEGRKVSRVAHRLAVSPKKVRRVLRHLGMLVEQA